MLLFSGAWFVYPESGLVHLFMLVVSTLSWILVARIRLEFISAVWLAILPLFSLLLLLPNYQTTISFITGQASFGATTVNDWWIFHDAYFVGIEPPMTDLVNRFSRFDPNSVSSLLADNSFLEAVSDYWHVPFNSVLALFGLYFITPSESAGVLWVPWVLLTMLLAMLFVFSFIRNISSNFRNTSASVFFLRSLSIIGLIICLYFFVELKWWPAGKLLSYISPYVYLVMILPLLRPSGYHHRLGVDTIGTLTAFILVLSSLSFGAARVYSSTDRNGIGYYRNYPSIQGPNNKVRIAWDLTIENSGICSAVNVDNLFYNPFYSHYAKVKLAYAGIPFYTTKPIVGYFGKDEPLGFMPFVKTDCDIILQSDKDYRLHAVITRNEK